MQGYQGYGDVVARQGGAPQVEPGGYACLIAAVEDGSAEPNPYIGLTLNPIDPKTNKYMVTDREELSDPERNWRHTYRFFIGKFGESGIDWGRMKALTEAVEQTTQNKGFAYDGTKDGAEQTLVGKFVGCVFKRVGYVRKSGKHAGEYTEAIQLGGVTTADKARSGDFPPKWAEPKGVKSDAEKAAAAPRAPQVTPPPVAPPQPDLAEEDIPF